MCKALRRVLCVALLIFVLFTPDLFGAKRADETVSALSPIEYYPVESVDEWLSFLRDEEVAARVKHEDEVGPQWWLETEELEKQNPIIGSGKYSFIDAVEKPLKVWGTAIKQYNYHWIKDNGYVVVPTGVEIIEMGYSGYFYFKIRYGEYRITITINGVPKELHPKLDPMDEYDNNKYYAFSSYVTMKDGTVAAVALSETEPSSSFLGSCPKNVVGLPCMTAYYGYIQVTFARRPRSKITIGEWIEFVENLAFEKIQI